MEYLPKSCPGFKQIDNNWKTKDQNERFNNNTAKLLNLPEKYYSLQLHPSTSLHRVSSNGFVPLCKAILDFKRTKRKS